MYYQSDIQKRFLKHEVSINGLAITVNAGVGTPVSPEQLTPHLSCFFPSRALQQRFLAFTMLTRKRLVPWSKDKDTLTSPAGKSGNICKKKELDNLVILTRNLVHCT